MRKAKFLVMPVLAATAAVGVVAFHPGRAYSEPRFAQVAPAAVAGTYAIDPMHTSVGFEVEHMGLSRIQGRFNKMEGRIEVDPQRLDRSSVDVTIEASSIDTAVAPRDTHLRSADFFEVEKYPTLTFKSTQVRQEGNGYIADGQLTIKGVSKPVSIRFKAYGPIQGEGNELRGGIIAEPFTINRMDFGVGEDGKLPNGASAIGTDITVRLSAEALKKGAK